MKFHERKIDYAPLCRLLGITFRREALLREALTHRSAGSPNNERLEFLGDAVLSSTIAQELYHRFPEAGEGELTRMRANLVNRRRLAELARSLDLGHWLIMGPGELKSGGFERESNLADAYEAIIGAILEDQGYEICRRWILKQFLPLFAKLKERPLKDAKTRLQELLQGRGFPPPTYELVEARTGEPYFRVRCLIPLLPEPVEGEGRTRKGAEQEAAIKILTLLEERGSL